ncbi:MAG: 16S rRNA (guanine(527)-N(7))-methyltransferase RsmG [Bacteroides sp.]|nr:16S rRNA (guanine(527)-N(7))-methyltransferase RsmG [Bacteroides sp.]
MTDIILKYFPNLTETQKNQFAQLLTLYPEWNEKINVISRKDIDNIEVNHLLHSLAIAKFINFQSGSDVLDFGCGGGLPGIPLAIFFPDVHFHLIDRVGKKIKVAQEIAQTIGLKNVTFQHGDSGECHDKFDFVVSRAVMPQVDLVRLSKKNISSQQKNGLPNGVISLKGGDLSAELSSIKSTTEIADIEKYFTEDYFKTKKIVYTYIG